jgi:F-type H+-transporting ATPase subunit b
MFKFHGSHRKLWLLFFLVAALSLLFCSVALCAGEQVGGHGTADRSADLKDLLYRFINFALLVIILFWALKKVGIKEFFATRTAEIRQRLDDLKREKEAAEEKHRELERELREFGAEREEIIEQFKKEGLLEKEKILTEAKQRVNQIIRQAEWTIKQETQEASHRLKAEMISIAADKAQEIISKEITDHDQEHLVDEFLERVGKVH